MKFIQIIFSPTGGTKKAAETITSEWSKSVETIDLCDPSVDFAKCSFDKKDLVLIALPSYGGRVPALAAQRLSQIKGNTARCVLLCVYGNRAYEDTLAEMEDIAKKCGFNIAAAVSAIAEHSIMHQYAVGRPDKQDTQKLKDYAQTILDKINSEASNAPTNIPGNRPYKKAGGAVLVPKATKSCINCGVCAKNCPAQAIDPENLKTADSKKCISCMRCVSECPNSARKVNGTLVSIASVAIKKACSVKKDCELFI